MHMQNFDGLQDHLINQLNKVSNLSLRHKMIEIDKRRSKVRQSLERLASEFSPNDLMSIDGKWFKAIKHRYIASDLRRERRPLSLEGSRLYPGRYHLKNEPLSVYLGQTTDTIAREGNIDGADEPYAIFPIEVHVKKVVD